MLCNCPFPTVTLNKIQAHSQTKSYPEVQKCTPTLKHAHKQTNTKFKKQNTETVHSPGSTGCPPAYTEQVCNGRLEKDRKINPKIKQVGMEKIRQESCFFFYVRLLL